VVKSGVCGSNVFNSRIIICFTFTALLDGQRQQTNVLNICQQSQNHAMLHNQLPLKLWLSSAPLDSLTAQHSTPWEAYSLTASHEITFLLWYRSFITGLTRAYQWSLSQVTWIQSTPSYPISLRSSHLCLGLQSCLLPSGFLTKILYAFFFISPMKLHAPPVSSFWFDRINEIDKEHKLWAPHYAVFSSLLPVHPSYVQIFCSTPCSQTPSIWVLTLHIICTDATRS
jgi:hypothetical protein